MFTLFSVFFVMNNTFLSINDCFFGSEINKKARKKEKMLEKPYIKKKLTARFQLENLNAQLGLAQYTYRLARLSSALVYGSTKVFSCISLNTFTSCLFSILIHSVFGKPKLSLFLRCSLSFFRDSIAL